MDRSLTAVRAGFLSACVLFAWSWPRPAPEPEDCARPVSSGPAEVSCAPVGVAVPRLSGPARRLFGLPIDPNRADRLTLSTLPGIGPARAAAILEQRRIQPFANVHDLTRVKGLGPARVAAIVPYIAIGESLAPENESSVKSPGCRSCCGSSGGHSPAVPTASSQEDR